MVKWLISFLVIVALMVTVLGCGGDGDESAEPATPPVSSQTPGEPSPDEPTPTGPPPGPAEPTGTLTVAVNQVGTEPDIGPFTRQATAQRPFWSLMADYLVYEKSDGSGYVPGIAEEWEIAPDGTSITFKLRQGIQFHEGWGELTAEDVKFTIDTALNPEKSGWQTVQSNVNPLIDHIETSGPYELTIYCKGAVADLVLAHLAPSSQTGIGIVPKAYYDDKITEYANRDLDELVAIRAANKKPIFSGPYKIIEYTLGEKMAMEAVEDHWRMVPEFKTLVFKEVPELMTRVAMLQTGEADIAEINADQAVNLGGDGLNIVRVPGAETLALGLLGQWLPSVETYDPDLPWLDIRVREAMNLAINRDELATEFFHGMATPASDFMHIPYDLEERPPYPYDPDLAEQLLADAGYSGGFDYDMWIFDFAGRASPSDTMMAVAGYWDAVGLDVEIKSLNVMAVYGDIVTRNTTDVCFPYMTDAIAIPYIRSFVATNHSEGTAFPLYESPEHDAQIEAYGAASSTEEKIRLEVEIAQYLYDQYAFVPLLDIDKVWATRDTVANWNPLTVQYMSLEYATHAEPLGTFRLFEQP